MSGPASLLSVSVGSSAGMVRVGGVPIISQNGGAAAKAFAFPSNSSCHGTQSLPLSLVSNNSNCASFFSFKGCNTSTFKTAVAATDPSQLSSSNPPDKHQANKYYFLVANAKFMLDEEEHFKELLFERLRNYGERNKEQDFWLVIEPKFLDTFPNITKRLRRPAVALVSTNATWITFMKLRLDRVLSDSYEAGSPEEALASNPTTLEFEKPENWVAPYTKYEFGWWEPFLPTESKGSKV